MRNLLAFVLMIALVGSAAAADLGNQYKDTKTNSHVMMNPGTPDGREGGETIADAFAITALPFEDTGNTSDNVDDYDAECPYSGSTSPDVVYSYTPAADEFISVDLCGTGYDSKTYVIDGDMNIIACNDDFYFSDPDCGSYTSFIEMASLTGGVEYFIVVDGYGGAGGDYVLSVEVVTPPEPCVLECNGVEEGEPELVTDYMDVYNSGCNDDSGLYPFQSLQGTGDEMLDFCGVSGWYNFGSSQYRDTDWFIAAFGETGIIEWTLDAEIETYGFLLGGEVATCGANITVDEAITAGPCAPATMTLQGNPGDTVFLWVGPSEYTPPVGFVGNEYDYVGHFEGIEDGIIATSIMSFDGVKSLYR